MGPDTLSGIGAGETPPDYPLGPHDSRRACADRGWVGRGFGAVSSPLLDDSDPGDGRAVLRRLAVLPVQQHAAHRPARQRAGLPALLPDVSAEPGREISLLAHELSHRAPHVRRGPV